LAYEGGSKFKTAPGAIASFIVIAILTAFSAYKGWILFNNVNPSISKAGQIR
jgi:hypothetical protein